MEKKIGKGYATAMLSHQSMHDYQHPWYLPLLSLVEPRKPEKQRVFLDCVAKPCERSADDMLYRDLETTENLGECYSHFSRRANAGDST